MWLGLGNSTASQGRFKLRLTQSRCSSEPAGAHLIALQCASLCQASYSHVGSDETMRVDKLFLQPTPYVPNSPLPVLIYRDVLPGPRDEQSVTQFLTRHKAWEKGVSESIPMFFQATVPTDYTGYLGSRLKTPLSPQHTRMLRDLSRLLPPPIRGR